MRFEHSFSAPAESRVEGNVWPAKRCRGAKSINKKTAVAALLGVLAGGAALAAGVDKPAAPSVSSEVRSLIRKDLLDRSRSGEARTRRNIFMGNSGAAGEAGPPPSVAQPPLEAPAKQAEPESSGPDIRYVGCAVTARRTVAIVLVEGQALAVAQGDQVAGLFTVQKISPEVLALVDPDGRTRTISISGEKQ